MSGLPSSTPSRASSSSPRDGSSSRPRPGTSSSSPSSSSGNVLDVSDILEEIEDDDFPTYFSERDGRLFASHPTSCYPLPIDGREQQRLNAEHKALLQVIGAHFVGPVASLLAAEPGRQKLALDFGTGTGEWPMDMGRQFPHVLFAGLDIVPIQTRYPLPNVQFQLHDINERTEWANGTVDLVHARGISLATQNYAGILTEIARVLRPGGLFVSGEWSLLPTFHPSWNIENPSYYVPSLDRFYAVLGDALHRCRGLSSTTVYQIPVLLGNSGQFSGITPHNVYLPIGVWHQDPQMQRLGKVIRSALVKFTESVKLLLIESGMSEGDVEALYTAVKNELANSNGLVLAYHTVYATRN